MLPLLLTWPMFTTADVLMFLAAIPAGVGGCLLGVRAADAINRRLGRDAPLLPSSLLVRALTCSGGILRVGTEVTNTLPGNDAVLVSRGGLGDGQAVQLLVLLAVAHQSLGGDVVTYGLNW